MRVTIVTWDGGGNLPPAIALAQGLAARGHACRFLGYRTQRERITARGFPFDPMARTGDFDLVATAPEARMKGLMERVFSAADHVDDVADALAAEPADVLVVDFVMHGALAEAERRRVPTLSFVTSAIAGVVTPRGSPMALARVAATNAIRARAGLPSIEHTTDAWDRFPMIVTTLRELDTDAPRMPERAHYVGPLVEQFPPRAWESPFAPDDRRPLVVASFTTTGYWDQRSVTERTAAAMAGEPVRLLVCDAAAKDMTLPPNARASGFVPHAAVLPGAAAVVTHCGHGTVAAALANGVPVVGLPNKAADQPYLAQRVQDLGAGLALDCEASPEVIREAVRRVMAEEAFAAAARRLGAAIAAAPGVAGAVKIVEEVARAEPS